MELPPIAVTGPADRRLAATLREIAPLIDELRSGVLVIGGLMTRLWLHAKPLDVPVRPTADVDLGIDRLALRLVGDRRLVGPTLDRLGFKPGHGGEPFRYSKEVPGVGVVVVDLVVPRGASRADPPIVERGLESIAAPGLAYALLRPTVEMQGVFVDDGRAHEFELPLPPCDGAFVLKAALAESGVRTRPDRARSDTVDAITMAAVCLTDRDALGALKQHADRTDVRKSLAWLGDFFRSPTAIGSRRVDDHYRDEGYRPGSMGEWANDVAQRLLSRL